MISNAEVLGVVESEGLGYAVTDYLNASSIDDPDLRKVWRAAAEALAQLESALDALR